MSEYYLKGSEMAFKKSLSICVVVYVVLGSVAGFAQREYEPVLFWGSSIPDPGMDPTPLNNIVVYAYDAALSTWHPIPFQIDQVPYFEDNDGTLDGDDEIVILSQDFGDQAPPEAWIDDPTSRKYWRYQVLTIDGVLGGTSYAYLFRTDVPGSHTKAPGYITYNANADRIISGQYEFGFNEEGLFSFASIPISAGGGGYDIIERLKIRGVGNVNLPLLGAVQFEITEVGVKKSRAYAADNTRDPVVRVVRVWYINIDATAKGDWGSITYPIENQIFTLKFYPNMADFGSAKFKMPADYEPVLKYFRYSIDLNESANGMRMFSPIMLSHSPDGALINRAADPTDIGMPRDFTNDFEWWMQKGDGGTALMVLQMPGLNGVSEQLYYKDAASGNNDNPPYNSIEDTGDKVSWGDTGLKLSGDITAGTEIRIGGKLYFYGSDFSLADAAQIKSFVETPLERQITHSTYLPVELVAFTGVAERNRVRLMWQTASESNNLGFEVQRQVNNSGEWDKIGFVNGRGTTSDVQSYSFQDSPGVTGQVLYRLKQVDSDGTYEIFEPVTVNVRTPDRYVLNQNFPNPFNPSTVLSFEIPESAEGITELEIFDLLGRKVRSLWRQTAGAGYYRVEWDGRDDDDRITGSGVYIAVLSNGSFLITRKMVKLQ
jgi:hypothetical protein